MTNPNLDILQRKVGKWGEKTFPDTNTEKIAAHLAEEMIELLGTWHVKKALERAYEKEEIYEPDVDIAPAVNPAEESADCLLLLLHLAYRFDFSLYASAREKFVEIQTRQWDDGAERGYSKHIEASE